MSLGLPLVDSAHILVSSQQSVAIRNCHAYCSRVLFFVDISPVIRHAMHQEGEAANSATLSARVLELERELGVAKRAAKQADTAKKVHVAKKGTLSTDEKAA